MPDAHDTDRRLVDLEVKLSFLEETVDRLNDVIVRQQGDIERLQRELARLAASQQSSAEPAAFRSLRDELPPHY